jgi:hypothetical protein
MKEIVQQDEQLIEIDYDILDDNGEPTVVEVEEINGEYKYIIPDDVIIINK